MNGIIHVFVNIFFNKLPKTKDDVVFITRHQREVNSRILREQESEYQRSLAADRARLNEKKRSENERKMAEMKEAEKKRKKLEKKKVIFCQYNNSSR